MATLCMPVKQEQVTRKDFVEWVDKYIHFKGEVQLPGQEVYGARCALLHQNGVISKLSQSGKCRMLAFTDRSWPEIHYDPNVSKELVLVSMLALKDAFFSGIDSCIVELTADKSRRELLDNRINWMMRLSEIDNTKNSIKV